MTVVDAQEKLEVITRNLADSGISIEQRHKYEAQMTRCNRTIQKARQQAHKSLASFAEVLLGMIGNTVFDQNHNTALITAAHLIRGASIEQLAIAVPAAIREAPARAIRPTRINCPQFTDAIVCLLRLNSIGFTYERNVAIRTALHLSKIVESAQIYRSVRRAEADTGESSSNDVVKKLPGRCSAHGSRKSMRSSQVAVAKGIITLRVPSTI
jgi:hypothetical protein